MDVLEGLGAITGLLVFLALLALVIAAIVMPLYVMAIYGHVKTIRKIEVERFKYFLSTNQYDDDEIMLHYHRQMLSKKDVKEIQELKAGSK